MRRRGIRSFCHGVDSTSTMQRRLVGGGTDADAASSSVGVAESEAAAVTLEQMILQLDLEEAAAARKAQQQPRRASCVNSSDRVLRSARDALSQYPRFSLDGRDAMYRASFSDYYDGMGLTSSSGHRRSSACCEMDLERTLRMPPTVAGESVVWCKPGVVAKLMGLDAVPVPVRGGRRAAGGRRKATGPPPPASVIGSGRKRRVRRTGREEEEEEEKEKLFMALHGYDVAGAGACHAAGALHPSVGPSVSGMGMGAEDGWGFRLPR